MLSKSFSVMVSIGLVSLKLFSPFITVVGNFAFYREHESFLLLLGSQSTLDYL